MGCCKAWAKWTIGIISVIVIAVALICGLKIYLNEKNKSWTKMTNNIPFIFILISMCVAVVVSLFGLLVCCCNKKCILVTYIILIIIVILVEIGAIVLAFCFRKKLTDDIQTNWNDQNYLQKRQKVEQDYQCCGFRNSTDVKGRCGFDPGEGKQAENCYKQINNQIKNNFYSLRAATVVMCAIEVVLFICACILECCYKKSDNEGIEKF